MHARALLLFWLTLSVLSLVSGQAIVYPGDANNNGHVDHYDVLSIGYAYGSTGPVRLDTGGLSQQHILVYWENNFPDGLNYSYADANNNGQVDFLDFFTLSLNNGISFTEVDELIFSEQLPGNDATIELEQDGPFDAALISGQQLEIPIKVSSLSPDRAVNGLALNLVYDPDFFSVFDFTFSQEWINADNGSFTIISESTGQIHLGITRFGVDPVNGDGTIGTLSLTIIEDLVGLLPNVPDSIIEFVSVEGVQLYDQDFELIPTGIAAMGLINSLPSGTENSLLIADGPTVNCVPNPSNGSFGITGSLAFGHVELITRLGHKKTLYEGDERTDLSVDLQDHPSGTYFLRCRGAKGQATVPIVIRR